MVSPQPAAVARVPSYPSRAAVASAPQLQRAPSQQGRTNSHSKSHHSHSHSHAQSSPRRRSLPFLEPSDSDTSPYLFDLYDDESSMVRPEALTSGADDVDIGLGLGLGLPDVSHLDAMLADLPPMYDPASAMDELPLSSGASDLQPQLGSSDIECERCWESGTRCADCTRRKQAQFGAHGWPIDSQPPQQPPTFVKQESNPGFLPWSLNADVALAQPPQPQPHLLAEEEKSSSLQLPPLSESLLPAHAATAATAAEAVHPSRLPGRLTRFLPEGVDMAAVELDPHYHTAFAAEAMEQQQQQAQQQQPVAPLRSQRIRRPSARSRSLSPDSLDDRSATPDTFALDSAYETDHLDEQDDSDESVPTTPVLQQQQPLPQHQPQQAQTPRPQKKQKTQHTPQPPSQSQQQQSSSMQIQPPSPLQRGDSLARIKPGELADDTISPSALAGAGGSGESSAEPPQPTRLLPVSARDLLPSRPSTAAIPPAHIKDRLVRSAKKLLTAADGANENVQVQVIPLWYPSKGAAGAHKIRLIRVENTADRSVSVYAHAADVGGVVERKSNISRLFGKFDSPQEKMLMNVVGAHNHQVGQESNILTLRGVKKFLLTNKMKSESAYRDWITRVLLPKLQFDPLEVGDEEVEIEASTNPNQPTRVKPKKLKRSEKKRKAEGEVAATAGTASGASAPLPPSPPSSKRAKLAGGVSSSSPPFASSSPFLAHLPAHLQQAFGSHHGHHHPASLAMAHMQPFSIAGLQTDANSSHAA